MEIINVVEQGSVIKKTDIQFCIYKEGVLNERIPYFKVDKIVLWGNQTVTTAAFNLAFEKGIDIIFLSLKPSKIKLFVSIEVIDIISAILPRATKSR